MHTELPVSIAIIARLTIAFALAIGGVLALERGFRLFTVKGMQQASAIFSFGKIHFYAKSVGAVVMMTACIWAGLAYLTAPTYHGPGGDVVSLELNKASDQFAKDGLIIQKLTKTINQMSQQQDELLEQIDNTQVDQLARSGDTIEKFYATMNKMKAQQDELLAEISNSQMKLVTAVAAAKSESSKLGFPNDFSLITGPFSSQDRYGYAAAGLSLRFQNFMPQSYQQAEFDKDRFEFLTYRLAYMKRISNFVRLAGVDDFYDYREVGPSAPNHGVAVFDSIRQSMGYGTLF